MARFLITVWPFSGHINPNIALAEALRERGHEVAFYTGASACRSIEGEGFHCFPFQRVDEAQVQRIVLSSDGILSRPSPPKLKAMWRTWVLDTVPAQLADLDHVLRTWQPDAIVCDPTMWGPFLILHEARDIPVAIFSLIPACLLFGRDAPIAGFPLPPARHPLQRWRKRVLRGVVNRFLGDVRRDASALRQSYGLAALQTSVTDFAGQMPLYLVPGSPSFDYQRDDLPPPVHYVGPCLWNKPRRDVPPDWLSQLPQDQPLVYASEGTIHLQPRVLRAAAEGLADLPIQVVMTTGEHRDPETMELGPRPLAPNIRVERWVALDHLLPHLDAMITIGGPGTLLAALQRGIPVVIVPFNWDHPETALRVTDTGVGIYLTPDECTPERMREAVQRVLSEPSFRESARRLAAEFAACGGPPRAAQLLEALLTREPASPVLVDG